MLNRKLYRQVARLHGISVKEVKRAMQAAVDEAYKSPTDYALGINPKSKGNPVFSDCPRLDTAENRRCSRADRQKHSQSLRNGD